MVIYFLKKCFSRALFYFLAAISCVFLKSYIGVVFNAVCFVAELLSHTRSKEQSMRLLNGLCSVIMAYFVFFNKPMYYFLPAIATIANATLHISTMKADENQVLYGIECLFWSVFYLVILNIPAMLVCMHNLCITVKERLENDD